MRDDWCMKLPYAHKNKLGIGGALKQYLGTTCTTDLSYLLGETW